MPVPSPEVYGDIAADEVVQAINQRMTRRNYSIPMGLVVSAALIALSTPWQVVVVVGPVIIVLLSLWHNKSRCSALHYEEDKETTSRLQGLHKAVTALRSCDSVWAVRETSLALSLTPRPATLSRTRIANEPSPLPKYLKTNIAPAALQLSDSTIYFFPDRLFIWHSDRFSAINYPEIKLRFSRVRFLERESQPADALAESSFRHALLDETRIPILWYGSVEFDAAPALQLRLMTSRPESAQEFITQLRCVSGGADAQETIEAGVAPLYTHFDSNCVPLYYDVSEKAVRQFQAARDAFVSLARCSFVWRYEGEQRIEDWKRNAGAGMLITRSRIIPRLVDEAPGLASNALVGLFLGDTTLYLLPDGFVIGAGNAYHAAGQDLAVHASTTNFRESDVTPHDGEIIGKTWRYVNKDGGPDRRFNDNRQIPIYRYGQVLMTCGTWRVSLCLSRADAASDFATALRTALGQEREEGTRKQRSEPPPLRKTQTADLTAAFRLLGLRPGASLEDASAAYRSLAAQNHPDKVAQMAPEFRELAERKMRELNAAHEQIRASLQ